MEQVNAKFYVVNPDKKDINKCKEILKKEISDVIDNNQKIKIVITSSDEEFNKTNVMAGAININYGESIILSCKIIDLLHKMLVEYNR